MSVKVRVDTKSIKDGILQIDKATERRYNKHRLDIGEIFVQLCTPYVPRDTGQMADSGHAYVNASGQLAAIWSRSHKNFDIAYHQYYDGTFQKDDGYYTHTPPQTKYWAQQAMFDRGDEFRVRVAQLMNKGK